MTTCQRITRGLQHAVLGVAVVLLLALGIGPRTGAYQTWKVLSGSMRPAMPAGSLAVVTPQPLRALEVGQVLIYHPPGGEVPVVAHRVVEILERGEAPVIRTKGDANEQADPWVARLEHGPAWTVQAVIPYAGFVLSWLQRPVVHRLTLWVAPLLLIAVALGHIWRREPLPGRPYVPAVRPPDAAAGWYRHWPSMQLFPLPGARGDWYLDAGGAGLDRSSPSFAGARRVASGSGLTLLALLALSVPAGAALADAAAADLAVSTGVLNAPTNVGAAKKCDLLAAWTHNVVSWSAPASGVAPDGYEVQRQVDSGAFTTVATVTGTSYEDPVTDTTRSYTYQVRALRSQWTSAWAGPSNTIGPLSACS